MINQLSVDHVAFTKTWESQRKVHLKNSKTQLPRNQLIVLGKYTDTPESAPVLDVSLQWLWQAARGQRDMQLLT